MGGSFQEVTPPPLGVVQTLCTSLGGGVADGNSSSSNSSSMECQSDSDSPRGGGAASEASTAVLRRDVSATAAARCSKHGAGAMEVRCAREGCEAQEQLLAPRSDKMKKCAACHAVYYCSKKCQREDWPRHRSQCAPAAGGGGRAEEDVGDSVA